MNSSIQRALDVKSWTRRDFLAAGGATTLILGVGGASSVYLRERDFAGQVSLDVFRSDDLLKFRIQSADLILERRSFRRGLAIRPKSRNSSALLQVVFPPQHLLEQVTPEDTSIVQLPQRGTIGFLPSYETSLVFRWPDSLKYLSIAEDELTKVFGFECIFETISGSGPRSHIEPVTGLTLTPAYPEKCRWLVRGLGTTKDYNPLWTLSLGSTKEPTEMWVATSRSVGAPFTAPLNDPDRSNIAEAFSGQTPKCATASGSADAVIPAPQVSQLVLSSQGAWLDLKGGWDPVPGCGLAQWTQEVSHGRDHFVEVVYKTWCYPDGIPVLLVKQTTREFQRGSSSNGKDGGVGAYLRIRLLVRPTKDSRLGGGEDTFESPFTEVFLPSDGIPLLDLDKTHGDRPAAANGYVIGDISQAQIDLGQIAFRPLLGGKPMKFRARVRDHAGKEHDIEREFILVGNALMQYNAEHHIQLKDPTHEQLLDAAWEASDAKTVDMGRTTWAAARQKSQADSSITIVNMDVVRAKSRGNTRPFYSRIHRLISTVDVSRALAGKAIDVPFTYRRTYQPLPADARLENDSVLDPDTGTTEAFLRVHSDQSVPMEIASGAQRQLGAVISPSSNIGGMARGRGLVLGSPALPAIATPDQIFPESAKLLGAFALKQLLKSTAEIPAWHFSAGEYEPIPPSGQASADSAVSNADEEPLIDGWVASFGWTTDQIQSTQGFFGALEGARLSVLASVASKQSTGQVVWGSQGELTDFFIAFPSASAPWIKVVFDILAFDSSSSSPPSFRCAIAKVEFDGLLKLLDTLREALKLPPKLEIDISPERINVSYEIGKDSVEIIGLTLSQLNIRTGVSLSLKGEPVEINLGLGRKSQPFAITSANGYGGAGYLELRANSSGIGMFALSLEFGEIVKKNFGGVATGEASLMAGFYFSSAANSFQFEGFVRLHGCLAVLGIGGIDIMAYLGLKWSQCGGNNFEGQCEVRVTQHIGPLEVSVGFTASHSFGDGCPPGNSRAALMTLEQFCEVCA
jgi:hypothetical protein